MGFCDIITKNCLTIMGKGFTLKMGKALSHNMNCEVFS